MATAFHSSYLAGRSPFWPTHFADPSDRRERTRRAAKRPLDPQVLDILRAQNPGVALSTGNTAFVVTGQQIGLFLGPLYTLYKAATAIALARQLGRESGVTCLPLFWLQTEDHDFPEIAESHFLGADGAVHTARLHGDTARTSVAQRVVEGDLMPQLAAIGDRGHAVVAMLARHYHPGARLADAFAGALREIFAEESLLVFNPRDSRLDASRVWQRALTDDVAIEEALETRGAALREAGFAEQIVRRPRSPLLFFHVDDATGPRFRLERNGDTYHQVLAHTFSRRDLLALCEAEPLRFSSSAMLRPILQDTLLPTAAYVGGAAELDYFAQIEPIFARFELEPPLLFHRARFRLWTPPASRAREALSLRESDCARPYAELAAQLAPQASETPSPAWVSAITSRLSAFAASTDSSELRRVAQRTERSIAYAMGRLVRQAERERRERAGSQEGRLQRLLTWMQPKGQPQERVFGFASFAARSSVADLRRAIFAAIDPLDASLKDVHL
jgi:bacillithiol biosynthesis cysteine-adding enzyme BshC